MKASSEIKSGAVAAESDQLAQVGGVETTRLYGPGSAHWGSAVAHAQWPDFIWGAGTLGAWSLLADGMIVLRPHHGETKKG